MPLVPRPFLELGFYFFVEIVILRSPFLHGGFSMKKTYLVRLTDGERQTCLDVVKKLKGSSQKVRRANILLKADADGPNGTDHAIALRCSDPPEGRTAWTLRLLADKIVELEIAPRCSRMTVLRTLKKTT
jgi:hypothetical protein